MTIAMCDYLVYLLEMHPMKVAEMIGYRVNIRTQTGHMSVNRGFHAEYHSRQNFCRQNSFDFTFKFVGTWYS